MKKNLFFIVVLVCFCTCNEKNSDITATQNDSLNNISIIRNDTIKVDATRKIIVADTLSSSQILTANVSVDSIISFAESLIGTPYLYASIDPQKGFDCSGFITYVFNHFKISVPRSSIDFTNVGTEVPVQDSKKGDLILFTGTDSTERFVGHMGIVIANANGNLQFIHSSSGKANGVVITPLNEYYKGRFIKVIRIF